MANNKTGFNYFNIDTDRYQDIKIKRLKKDFGCSGIAVYDYILCEVYRVKGCFLEWDSNTAFDVADYFGIKESLVLEIVNYCGNVGLFDKALLICGGVITSASIQSRYSEMCNRAKRTICEIPEKCKIIPEESNIIQEESTDYSGDLPQSKVKYSKVKESKEEKKEEPSAFDVVFEEFLLMRRKIKKPATDKAIDLIKKELTKLSVGDEDISIKILEQSIKNCWQDVYPLKNKDLEKEKSCAKKEKTVDEALAEALIKKYGTN